MSVCEVSSLKSRVIATTNKTGDIGEKRVDLPFIPHVGMILEFNDGDDDCVHLRVRSVVWNVDDSELFVSCDVQLYDWDEIERIRGRLGWRLE
jgi:hypothetical protein